MYRRHSISNIARVTNSTWIEGGNKSAKITKVTRNFLGTTKKTTLINIARIRK